MLDIKKKFNNAPNDIKILILDDNFDAEIILIGQEVGITDAQSLDVENEVIRVLLGELNPDKFEQAIEQKIGVSAETAKNIAAEIDKSIFSQVRDSLNTLYGKQTLEQPAPPQTISPAPTIEPDIIPARDTVAPPQNLPGGPQSPIIEPKVTPAAPQPEQSGPSDEHSAEGIEAPVSIFEEKLKKAASGQQAGAPKPNMGAVDPYREPIE